MRDHDRTSAVPFVPWVQLSHHVSNDSTVGKKQLIEFPRLKSQFWLQAASCLVWVIKKEHRSIP